MGFLSSKAMEFSEEIALAGDVGLKQLKEAFVSNLHGSTMAEIAALTAVVPTFIILRQLGGLILPAAKEDVTSSDGEVKGDRSLALGGPNYRTRLLSDFIFVILPTLACLTVIRASLFCTILNTLTSISFFSDL